MGTLRKNEHVTECRHCGEVVAYTDEDKVYSDWDERDARSMSVVCVECKKETTEEEPVGTEEDGLRESLRIANKRVAELEAGFLKVHQLIEPGADWYSWQRVYQNVERVLKAAAPVVQRDRRVVTRESRVASDLIAGLNQLKDKLKRGEPIEATGVTREQTPDGPLHTAEKVTLTPVATPTPPPASPWLDQPDEEGTWEREYSPEEKTQIAHVERLRNGKLIVWCEEWSSVRFVDEVMCCRWRLIERKVRKYDEATLRAVQVYTRCCESREAGKEIERLIGQPLPEERQTG